MKKSLLLLLFMDVINLVFLQSEVQLREEQIILPTYPVTPSEKALIFFKNEAFQGALRHYYPLRLINYIWFHHYFNYQKYIK